MEKNTKDQSDIVIKITEIMTFFQTREQTLENITEILQRILDLINMLDDIEKTYYLNDLEPAILIPSRGMPNSNGFNQNAEEILNIWIKLKKENHKLDFISLKDFIKNSDMLSNAYFDNVNPDKIFLAEAAGRNNEHDLFIIEKKSDTELSDYEKNYIKKISDCAKLINENILAGEVHIENEKILTEVLNNIDALIYVSDIKTNEVLFANNAMRKGFGIEDIKGRVCWEVFQQGFSGVCDFCPVHNLNSIDDAPIVWEEHNTVTGRYYQNTDRLIKWIDNRIVHLQYSMDITNIKNAEKDLSLARDIAEKNARAKSEFLSKMSHELRTPLNAILGMINMIDKSEDLEKINRFIQKMKSASNNLLQTINDILDISKIEAGKMEIINGTFNLEEMLRGTFDIIEYMAHDKGISIEIDMIEKNNSYFIGDAKRLGQVYMNLLSNAVKFTENGGKIVVSIKYNYLENGLVEIISSVKDNGIGIPKDKIDSIFKSFTQVDNSLSRQYNGSGLGLIITKNIIELMGGSISVESTVNEGSIFSFNVLLKPCEEKPEIEVLPEIFNILIIDDSIETCEYLSSLFSARNIKHTIANSGEEGLEIVSSSDETFNIILVDYLMPSMNGLETIKQLHTIVDPNTIIIMISSIDWDQIEAEAKQVGINKFLPKPLLPSDIINSINEIFRKKSIKHITPTEEEEFDFSGKTILLFEDVDINREIIQFLLENTNASCIEAVDGEIGVNMFKENPEKYDLILMDIQMPNMDGLEATKLIRQSDVPNAKSIPIIAMTANVFAEQIQDALDAGMNSHVGKPVDEIELKKEVKKWLNLKS